MEFCSASERQDFCPKEGFSPLSSLYINPVSKSVLGLTLSGNSIPVQYGAGPVRIPPPSLFPCASSAQLGFAGITAAQLQALLVKCSAALVLLNSNKEIAVAGPQIYCIKNILGSVALNRDIIHAVLNTLNCHSSRALSVLVATHPYLWNS